MTAVEFLKKKLPSLFQDDSGHYATLFEQAKEMERQSEISDEEILQAGKNFFSEVIGATQNDVSAWISGCEWYREQLRKHDVSSTLLAVNPFIANTAKDYDISYEAVEVYYNRYGSTSMFYEKLEEHLKLRTF